jgi:cell division septal protein FtsQ
MVNHHKMKRTWKRRLKKTARLLARDDARGQTHQKDFAWKKRKTNPYRSADEWPYRKVKIQLTVLLFSLSATVGLLLYHPFFYIRHVEAYGMQRIDKKELLSTVQGMIRYNSWLIFPKKNFFLFDKEEIEEILLARFPVRTVFVETHFPGTLSIILEERISTLIYDNGNQYVYVGGDGRVIEPLRQVRPDEWLVETQTVTSTDEFGQEISREETIREEHRPAIDGLFSEFGRYPIVYDSRGQKAQPQEAVLKPETPKKIFAWFHFLERQSDISFRYMTIDSEIGDAIIQTGEGWELRVRLTDSIDRQVDDLEEALRDSIDRSTVRYIDLRYPGRVYWQ